MKYLLLIFPLLVNLAFAETSQPEMPHKIMGEGWSFDIGGNYTWMSLTTPPTYSGSTGGILGRVTYQKPFAVFGQARTVYNLGPLSSSQNDARIYEWYSEFVGGYCANALNHWSITPYAGLGLDFIHANQSGYSTIAPIKLRYALYYAIAGLDTRYAWQNWMLGLQVDCLPIFKNYLQIKSLTGAAWTLSNRTGAAVRLPVAYRYVKNFWIELTPYYRYLPIGSSNTLGLMHRNLNQWGAFLTFCFFI